MYLQYLVANKMMATVAVLEEKKQMSNPCLSTQSLCLVENSAETLPTIQQHHLLHTVTVKFGISVSFQKFQSYCKHVFLTKFVVKNFLLRLSQALL
jgi:hypothetical protein